MTRCCQIMCQSVMQWESRTQVHKKVESPRVVDIASLTAAGTGVLLENRSGDDALQRR